MSLLKVLLKLTERQFETLKWCKGLLNSTRLDLLETFKGLRKPRRGFLTFYGHNKYDTRG